MDLATLIPLALKTSIVFIVFGLALNASLDDALYLFRRPRELVRSLLSMNVIMPLFAAAIAVIFGLHPAVKIALLVLAVSPVPPILPKKEIKAGGARPTRSDCSSQRRCSRSSWCPSAWSCWGELSGEHSTSRLPPSRS